MKLSLSQKLLLKKLLAVLIDLKKAATQKIKMQLEQLVSENFEDFSATIEYSVTQQTTVDIPEVVAFDYVIAKLIEDCLKILVPLQDADDALRSTLDSLKQSTLQKLDVVLQSELHVRDKLSPYQQAVIEKLPQLEIVNQFMVGDMQVRKQYCYPGVASCLGTRRLGYWKLLDVVSNELQKLKSEEVDNAKQLDLLKTIEKIKISMEQEKRRLSFGQAAINAVGHYLRIVNVADRDLSIDEVLSETKDQNCFVVLLIKNFIEHGKEKEWLDTLIAVLSRIYMDLKKDPIEILDSIINEAADKNTEYPRLMPVVVHALLLHAHTSRSETELKLPNNQKSLEDRISKTNRFFSGCDLPVSQQLIASLSNVIERLNITSLERLFVFAGKNVSDTNSEPKGKVEYHNMLLLYFCHTLSSIWNKFLQNKIKKESTVFSAIGVTIKALEGRKEFYFRVGGLINSYGMGLFELHAELSAQIYEYFYRKDANSIPVQVYKYYGLAYSVLQTDDLEVPGKLYRGAAELKHKEMYLIENKLLEPKQIFAHIRALSSKYHLKLLELYELYELYKKTYAEYLSDIGNSFSIARRKAAMHVACVNFITEFNQISQLDKHGVLFLSKVDFSSDSVKEFEAFMQKDVANTLVENKLLEPKQIFVHIQALSSKYHLKLLELYELYELYKKTYVEYLSDIGNSFSIARRKAAMHVACVNFITEFNQISQLDKHGVLFLSKVDFSSDSVKEFEAFMQKDVANTLVLSEKTQLQSQLLLDIHREWPNGNLIFILDGKEFIPTSVDCTGKIIAAGNLNVPCLEELSVTPRKLDWQVIIKNIVEQLVVNSVKKQAIKAILEMYATQAIYAEFLNMTARALTWNGFSITHWRLVCQFLEVYVNKEEVRFKLKMNREHIDRRTFKKLGSQVAVTGEFVIDLSGTQAKYELIGCNIATIKYIDEKCPVAIFRLTPHMLKLSSDRAFEAYDPFYEYSNFVADFFDRKLEGSFGVLEICFDLDSKSYDEASVKRLLIEFYEGRKDFQATAAALFSLVNTKLSIHDLNIEARKRYEALGQMVIGGMLFYAQYVLHKANKNNDIDPIQQINITKEIFKIYKTAANFFNNCQFPLKSNQNINNPYHLFKVIEQRLFHIWTMAIQAKEAQARMQAQIEALTAATVANSPSPSQSAVPQLYPLLPDNTEAQLLSNEFHDRNKRASFFGAEFIQYIKHYLRVSMSGYVSIEQVLMIAPDQNDFVVIIIKEFINTGNYQEILEALAVVLRQLHAIDMTNMVDLLTKLESITHDKKAPEITQMVAHVLFLQNAYHTSLEKQQEQTVLMNAFKEIHQFFSSYKEAHAIPQHVTFLIIQTLQRLEPTNLKAIKLSEKNAACNLMLLASYIKLKMAWENYARYLLAPEEFIRLLAIEIKTLIDSNEFYFNEVNLINAYRLELCYLHKILSDEFFALFNYQEPQNIPLEIYQYFVFANETLEKERQIANHLRQQTSAAKPATNLKLKMQLNQTLESTENLAQKVLYKLAGNLPFAEVTHKQGLINLLAICLKTKNIAVNILDKSWQDELILILAHALKPFLEVKKNNSGIRFFMPSFKIVVNESVGNILEDEKLRKAINHVLDDYLLRLQMLKLNSSKYEPSAPPISGYTTPAQFQPSAPPISGYNTPISAISEQIRTPEYR